MVWKCDKHVFRLEMEYYFTHMAASQYIIRLDQFSCTSSSIWSRISAMTSRMLTFKCSIVYGLSAVCFNGVPQKMVQLC